MNNLREKSAVYFRFPVIADLDPKVARLCGMVQPGESETAALRAPKALQFVDEYHVLTPRNWQPGDKVILPAPQTLEQLDARLTDESVGKKMDFYLAKKQVSEPLIS